jgi:hypothetical protein
MEEGDRPAAPPRPTNPSDGPPRFSDLPAADQLRVVEILRPGWEKAIARYQARKAAEHVKAA